MKNKLPAYNVKGVVRSKKEIKKLKDYCLKNNSLEERALKIFFNVWMNNDLDSELLLLAFKYKIYSTAFFYYDSYMANMTTQLKERNRKVEESCLEVLSKHNLSKYKEDLIVFSNILRMSATWANVHEEFKKDRRKVFQILREENWQSELVKYNIQEFLMNNPNHINEIILRTKNNKKLTILDSETITSIITVLNENTKDSYGFLPHPKTLINLVGKPQNEEKATLRKGLKFLMEYLDQKNELIQDPGVKLSEDRVKFVGDFYEALYLLPDIGVPTNVYIRSLDND
jgi:hypothetical protein